MPVEYEVSIKDALSFVMYGLADQGELGEGGDVTVDTHHADQLGWQSSSSSSLDGHRVRRRGEGGGSAVREEDRRAGAQGCL